MLLPSRYIDDDDDDDNDDDDDDNDDDDSSDDDDTSSMISILDPRNIALVNTNNCRSPTDRLPPFSSSSKSRNLTLSSSLSSV